MQEVDESKIAVVGLGYVGLPLAVEFGKQFEVVGFDINPRRVEELRKGTDRTLEVSDAELGDATLLSFTTDAQDIAGCTVYIVTTPTPIDEHKRPDLSPVLSATRTIARVLKCGDVVVYESTVYPGATEEECVPLLEEISGLMLNEDFFVGYSPERINPGDKEHRVNNIVKVTSGSTPKAGEYIDRLYQRIVKVGTHKAPSIKVAEAAKVIENTQRDVNIALMNELAILFNRLGIDTSDVLAASGTKWNFLPFQPGLVGGHCIGVDPYYLTHKAQAVGYHPEIILAGRRLNDSMGTYVASQLVKAMTRKGIQIRGARVLMMGLTFKENTPDLRNTKVIDIIRELEDYGISVDVQDPWADVDDASALHGIGLVETPEASAYHGIVIAVGHRQFRDLRPNEIQRLGAPGGFVVYDLKNVLSRVIEALRL